MEFSPGSATRDVGHDTLQISDALGEALHVEHRVLNLVEVVAHELEGLAETPLQCGLELFLDRGPHGFEFRVIVLLQTGQLGLHRGAEGFEFFIVRLCEPVQLVPESLELLVLEFEGFCH